jgi:hypothetical protein
MTRPRQVLLALVLSLACFTRLLSADHERDAVQAWLAEGRWGDAASVLEVHLAETPDDAQAWFDLARARAHLQQRDAVMVALRSAIEKGWSSRRASLAEIESAWKAWLLSQPEPFVHLAGARPSLGCSFRQRQEGIEVDQLTESGPAAQAGIQRGDLVIAAGGERVIDEEDLITPVFSRRIGDSLPLTVRRATGEVECVVVIGQAAPAAGASVPPPTLPPADSSVPPTSQTGDGMP